MSKPLTMLVVTAVGLLLWLGVKAHLQSDGALREQIHAREVTIAALARQHHTDTVRVVVTRHTTDSILKTDTIFTKVTVEKIVQAERNACDALMGTCEQEKAQLRGEIVDLKKANRGFRFLGIPLACVGGYVGSIKGQVDPGIGCGVPLLK